MSNPWNNHFPNSLGTLATQKRTAATARARLQRALSCITQATEELAPLVQALHPPSSLLNHSYAALVDSGEGITKLLRGE